MSKRTKGYIAALVFVCVLITGYLTEELKTYTFEEGKVSTIIEETMESIEEYFLFVNDAMHPGDVVRSQVYFRDYELEENAPVPTTITKYIITKSYGDWISICATVVTWGEGEDETMVFAYTELVEDKSGLIEYEPYMCDRMDVKEQIFGFFEYTITIPNDAKKIKVNELQKNKFEESSDGKCLTLYDEIMLIKDIAPEELTE